MINDEDDLGDQGRSYSDFSESRCMDAGAPEKIDLDPVDDRKKDEEKEENGEDVEELSFCAQK